MSTNKINKNLSIVIATLGGDSLFKTLTLINKSSTVPSEIFVCSPHIETQIYIPINKNIKFLLTKNFGQVAQRVEGLLKVSSSIVLQMDDDIFVNSDTIELLLKALNKRFYSLAIILLDRIDSSTISLDTRKACINASVKISNKLLEKLDSIDFILDLDLVMKKYLISGINQGNIRKFKIIISAIITIPEIESDQMLSDDIKRIKSIIDQDNKTHITSAAGGTIKYQLKYSIL